jgi:hypothetical protein
MADKTPADRRHDFQMLLLGFLLTTVAGGSGERQGCLRLSTESNAFLWITSDKR